jgi:tRNA (guanine37-N1)-methyltransferase
MWVGIVSLFPEMLEAAAAVGVLGRAVAEGIVDLDLVNPRSFATDRHNTVDDRPYGGGPGMVLMLDPLLSAIAAAQAKYSAKPSRQTSRAQVIYLSPGGERLTQDLAGELASLDGLILVAGRYEGIDERVVDQVVDRQLSVGDYVVSGGELPALVVLDAVARLLPGTLGNPASAIEESHLDGLLDYPQYTRPENHAGGLRLPERAEPAGGPASVHQRQVTANEETPANVPSVLLSGDHKRIRRWRLQQALLRTWRHRPDLLASRALTDFERELLSEVLADPADPGGK